MNEVSFPTRPPGLNNKRAAKKTRRPVMTLCRRYERPELHHETSLPMALAMLKIICICQVTLEALYEGVRSTLDSTRQ